MHTTKLCGSFLSRSTCTCVAVLLFLLVTLATASAQVPAPVSDLELTRPAHSWEFLDAVGMRAGLFGTQDGRFEAWVYPLKLVRDFRLVFRTADGREFPAESLARSITARPESITITYSGDEFTVDETWFVPVDVAGAAVQLDVETWTPLQIEARFHRDMQMMWPAELGATRHTWDPALHAFALADDSGRYYGLVGAAEAEAVHEMQKPASDEDALRLGTIQKGHGTRLVVIAGSVEGRAATEATYRRLSSEVATLREASAAHYREFLARTTSIQVPDPEVQQAYDWARLSMLQGMVDDPLLGTGLVAGYGRAGKGSRPGFAWFFGRDSLWTSLAMDSIGDFSNVRTALEFLMKFQKADGKIEHEIAQSAPLVPWFSGPFAYASADATPLFLIAMDQYARVSGDIPFVKSHWDNIWHAYSFLRSTWDADHHAQNTGVGHGWVEGGPLFPVKTELYQSGLGTEALRCLADMARMTGQPVSPVELDEEAERQRKALDRDFWSERINAYAFALDRQGARLDTPSVLTTVPMWFGLLEPAHAHATINTLARPDHAADWGMRIISDKDPRYDPSGYHFGSVWPLFTGWASVGEYRYHRPLPAFANLRASALLTLSGAPGRTTEVLSGSYFDSLSSSSPHQIWSSAMVVSPILRGMMGLQPDAPAHRLALAPHVPASWKQFAIRNVWVGTTRCDLRYVRTADEISLTAEARGDPLTLQFAPSVSLRARVDSVTVNGQPARFRVEANSQDQHLEIELRNLTRATVRVHLQHDFDIEAPVSVPAPGQKSRGVRVVAESWTEKRDQLTLGMYGLNGATYDFPVRGAGEISSVEGAKLVENGSGVKLLRVSFPDATGDAYVSKTVVVHFRE